MNLEQPQIGGGGGLSLVDSVRALPSWARRDTQLALDLQISPMEGGWARPGDEGPGSGWGLPL